MSAVFAEDTLVLLRARIATQEADNGRLLATRRRLQDTCQVTDTQADGPLKSDTFTLLASLRNRSGAPVSDVAVSAHGVVAFASWDGTASLWDIARWSELGNTSLAPAGQSQNGGNGRSDDFAASAIVKAKFSPSTPSLLGLAAGFGVHLWSQGEGKCERLAFLESEALVSALDFHSVQSMLCTGAEGQALIWDVDEHRVLRNLVCGDVEIAGCRFLGSSEAYKFSVATVQLNGTTRVWDLRRPKQLQCFEASDAATCLDSHADSHLLSVGYSDGRVVVWDMRTWGELARFAASSSRGTGLSNRDHTCLRSLAISPCGRSLAVGSMDGEMQVFDVKERSLAFRAHHHHDAVTGLSFAEPSLGWAPSSGFLAAASLDGGWSIWGEQQGLAAA